VRSDRHLLERILLNLVSNAVRYTQAGGVVVGCRRRGDALRLEVWDSGIGIPDDKQQDIFSEFYQVTADGTGAGAQGLGLGLAIVDRLCRLLDHPLTLASTPGKGSRFAITAPTALPEAEPLFAVPHPLQALLQPFSGKLIVVIDDDPLVLDGVGGLLRGWGATACPSMSSAEALDRLRELRQPPDLIICDYHLSQYGETGMVVIERLRRSFKATIPALLITGDVSVERKEEAEAGGYEILQKPVLPLTLRLTIIELLKPRDVPSARAALTPSAAANPSPVPQP
jgi:CheY-like chemotaxis protein